MYNARDRNVASFSHFSQLDRDDLEMNLDTWLRSWEVKNRTISDCKPVLRDIWQSREDV